MPCLPLHTGHEFLFSALTTIDCQARAIGAYGYGALSDPSSSVSVALSGLLTICVALFGIRLLIYRHVDGADVFGNIMRVAIVFTIAMSWPAWRTLAYDLVLDAPAEVANRVGDASGLPGSKGDMYVRLQDTDTALLQVTVWGSGRLTGDAADPEDSLQGTEGIAVGDQLALGAARVLFLTSTIGSALLIHIGAGIMLAIAPLMAGLLLFSGTVRLFAGWLASLSFCILGNIALTIAQGVELAILYPWLNDVLQQRSSRILTASAPTEMLVLCLGFAIATAAILWLTAKIAFWPTSARRAKPHVYARTKEPRFGSKNEAQSAPAVDDARSARLDRAQLISAAVSKTTIGGQRDLASYHRASAVSRSTPDRSTYLGAGHQEYAGPMDQLGSSYRRTRKRQTMSAHRRDR